MVSGLRLGGLCERRRPRRKHFIRHQLLKRFELLEQRMRRRPRRGHTARHQLLKRFELLEQRNLLSADGLVPQALYDDAAPLISPTWFADFSDALAPSHVNAATLTTDSIGALSSVTDSASIVGSEVAQYDWIVQFDTLPLEGISSVADTASLLVGGGVQFDVLRGLGIAGQVLLRSSEASIETVDTWLASNDAVASYELDVVQEYQLTSADPHMRRLWGMDNTGQLGGTIDADIDAAEAWQVSTGSSQIVVGVIDTGVDYTHVDLAANIWTNPGEIAGNGIDDDGNGFIDDIHGYDFVNNDGDPMDDNGHGTHVSGTIGGVGNNGIGVAGVNWNTSIMGLKFLSGNGSGYTSDAVRAVNYATMMRTMYDVDVRVTNNSWGGGGYSSALANAIQAGGNAGILFVAAAGNSGSNNDVSPQYPANYNLDSIISVAATDQYDNLASFSSYGVRSVDLAAPGVAIYSTVPGNGYAWYSGTSMATPHVAGVAALAWSVSPGASLAEIRGAILQSVDPLVSLDGKVATGGRLNAFGTLGQLEHYQLPASNQHIDFNNYAIESYGDGGQDMEGTATIEDGGATLRLVGNNWKMISLPVMVTPETVLEFDFRSSHQGEIQAIGFDIDDATSSDAAFQLHGSQSWSVQTFNDYGQSAPGYRHYVIPVGQYFTGQMQKLFFANDHDVVQPDSESVFSNVLIHGNPPTAENDSFAVTPDGGPMTLDVLANDSTDPDIGETLTIVAVDASSAGAALTIVNGTSLQYTPAVDFSGADSFTYTVNDGTPGSNATATVTVMYPGDQPLPGAQQSLDFNDYAIESYGGKQDVKGTATVEDGGATLRLVGNNWKKIHLPVMITSQTVLEFDFRSSHQGEIQAIGFDTDDVVSTNTTFQLYGSQSWSLQTFNDYGQSAPGYRHYVIPVGQYFTGQMQNLLFANDHDVAQPNSESVFSNILVHGNPPTAENDSFAVTPDDGPVTLDVLANDSAAPDIGETLTIVAVEASSAGAAVTIVNGTSLQYTPAADFSGSDSFTYTINDGTPGSNATATVIVMYPSAQPPPGEQPLPGEQQSLDFNDYTIESYGNGGQDIEGTVTVEDGGATLRLVGNNWKMINLPVMVTPETVLEFDFRSSHQGEIHAIGFDIDDATSSNAAFQLYGSQSWSQQTFHDYGQTAPGSRHYVIPVGQYFTGQMQNLFFTNDHDVVQPDSESVFSNVLIHGNPPTAEKDSFTVAPDGGPVTLDVLANDSAAPDVGEILTIVAVEASSAGAAVTIVNGTSLQYTPAADFSGADSFTYTINDGTPGSNATATVTVMSPDYHQPVDFNEHAIESYGNGGQDIKGTVTIEDGGATLRLVGNNWKMIHLPVTVTAETVLEFDFRSSHQGEIHAIGFDTDDVVSTNTTFQLYGSQSWSLQTFNDYGESAPGYRHYVIPVGQYFTGQMQNLLFANDHDVVRPDSEGLFSNILIYSNTSTAETLAGNSVASRAGEALTIIAESHATSSRIAELAGAALDNARSFCQDDVVVDHQSVDLLCNNYDLELKSPSALLHVAAPVLTLRPARSSAPLSSDSTDAGNETLDQVFKDLDLGSFDEELVAELAQAVA